MSRTIEAGERHAVGAMHTAALLFPLLLALGCLLALAGAARAEHPYNITGTVTAAGSPRAGVLVSACPSSGTSAVAQYMTTSLGTYALSLDAGIYDVVARPPAGSGLGQKVVRGVVIDADHTLDFALDDAGYPHLSGHVTFPDGTPLGGAKVTLVPAGGGALITTTADSDGRFSCAVTPDTYVMDITWRHWVGLRSPSISVSGDTDFELVLPARRVTVHVSGGGGAGVGTSGGLTYPTLAGLDGWLASTAWEPESTLTDAAGNVVIWLLSTDEGAEPYTVFATPSPGDGAHATTWVRNVTVTGERTIEVPLEPSVTIAGRFALPDGTPLAGVEVTVSPEGIPMDLHTTSDADGRISLPVAQWRYAIMAEGCSPEDAFEWTLDCPAFDVDGDIDLDLTFPAKRVVVHVTDENGPVAGAGVGATGMYGRFSVAGLGDWTGICNYRTGVPEIERTDAAGDAVLWLLPSGTDPGAARKSYAIAVEPPAGDGVHALTSANAEVTNDRTVEVVLQEGAAVSGRLTFPDGGAVTGAEVSVVYPDTLGTPQVTGADGLYSLRVAPADGRRRWLYVRWSGARGNGSDAVLSVRDFSPAPDLDITIPAKHVAVHVTDEHGPVVGAGVGSSQVTLGSFSLPGISSVCSAWNSWAPETHLTNDAGIASLWMLPTDAGPNRPEQSYTISVLPPAGSASNAVLNLHDVKVSEDMTLDVHTAATARGSDVRVTPISGVSLTYPTVTEPGLTAVTMSGEPPAAEPPPDAVYGGTYYGISTSAKYQNWLTVAVAYDDAGMSPAQERALALWHYDDQLATPAWVDCTWRVDTDANIVYGKVPHLSWFALGEPAAKTVAASAGPGGRIEPAGAVSVPAGSDQSFTVTADPGYEVAGLVVDGASLGPRSSYVFTAVLADHTIAATFKPAPLRLAAPACPAVLKGTVQTAAFSVSPPGVSTGSFALWLKNTGSGALTRLTPATSPIVAVAGRTSYETTWTASPAIGSYRLWVYQYAANSTTVVARAEAPADVTLVGPTPEAPAGSVARGSQQKVSFTVPAPGASTGFFRLYLKNAATNVLTQVTPTATPVTAVAGRTSYDATWTVSQAAADYRLQVNYYSSAGALLSSGLSSGVVTVEPYPTPSDITPASATLTRGAVQKVTWTVPASVTNGFFRLYLKNAATNVLTQVTPTAGPINVTNGVTSYETTWSVTHPAASYKLQVNYYAAGTTTALSSGLSGGTITVDADPLPTITAPAAGGILKGSPQTVCFTLPSAPGGGSYGLWLKNAQSGVLTRVTAAAALVPAAPGQTTYFLPWTATQALGSYWLIVYHYAADGITVLTTSAVPVPGIPTWDVVLPTVTGPTGTVTKGSMQTVTWTLPGSGTAAGSFRVFLKNAAGTALTVTTAAGAVKAEAGRTSYSAPWSVSQAAGNYTLWLYYYAANGTTLLCSAQGPGVTVQ